MENYTVSGVLTFSSEMEAERWARELAKSMADFLIKYHQPLSDSEREQLTDDLLYSAIETKKYSDVVSTSGEGDSNAI